jgi:hypothetical protein
MFNGLILGTFWIIKYILFIIGTRLPVVSFASVMLAPVTIVLAYVLTRLFRSVAGGGISFGRAWRYGIALYFFASLVEAIPQYVFFRYLVTPEYMEMIMTQAKELLDNINFNADARKDVMEQLSAFTPIQLTFQGIITNLAYGIILSIPVAAILCRKVSDPQPASEKNEL